jgi:hypothetical protein
MSAHLDTLKSMLSSAKSTLAHDTERLGEYRDDFNMEPAGDTLAQVKRTERKLVAGQTRIEALEYAVNVLEAVEGTVQS